MARSALLVLGLALLAVAAQAQTNNNAKALDAFIEENSNYKLFGALLDALGLTKPLPDTTMGTLFAPSDAAIKAFLSEMGLTVDEVKARPALLDLIVSYHFVPGVRITDSKIAEEKIGSDAAKPATLVTADGMDEIQIWKNPATGLYLLKDAQGNIAAVTSSKPRRIDEIAVWGVSRVLMSLSYFHSGEDALRAFPSLSTAYILRSRAVEAGGAIAEQIKASAGDTYLVPTDAAFASVSKKLAAAEPKELSELFEYLTLKGVRSVPKDFKDGEKVETALKGHFVTTKVSTKKGKGMYGDEEVPVLTVVGENGVSAATKYVNVFAGKSVLQVIDAVIAPKSGTAAAKSGNRKLLQTTDVERRATAAQWSGQNTSRAISAAASGRVPTDFATASGSANARRANCLNCQRWGSAW